MVTDEQMQALDEMVDSAAQLDRARRAAEERAARLELRVAQLEGEAQAIAELIEALKEEERELARAHAECDEYQAKYELWGHLTRIRAALAKHGGR